MFEFELNIKILNHFGYRGDRMNVCLLFKFNKKFFFVIQLFFNSGAKRVRETILLKKIVNFCRTIEAQIILYDYSFEAIYGAMVHAMYCRVKPKHRISFCC